MRIAVLTNAYPPHTRGGAGRIAALQVELLQQQGHHVRVWTTALDWTSDPFWKRLGIHLRDFVWIHPAAHEIGAWKPDVLLTHNLTGAGFRTPTAVQRLGIRWVHVLHDVQLFHPLGLLGDERVITVLQRCVTRTRRWIFGLPDKVISPTEWLLQAHLRRGWFKQSETAIVPNPAPPLTAQSKQAWNTPLKVLFASGRVTHDKGSEVLQRLMTTAPFPIEWQVIGAGANQLKNVPLPAGSSLDAVEQLTPEGVVARMQEADLLLVPSQIEENQPTVLLEAFAVGLPSVAQAKGGIPETLGEAGVLVCTANEADWWSAIERVLGESRTTWTQRAQIAWRRHAPERVVEALVASLKSNKKI